MLVDAYRDTNRLKSSILLALKPSGAGLTVVGDDAPSIYAFRAATVRNILEFPSRFATPATVVTLDRNNRSTQPIQLVNVDDEADQARFIPERLLENRETGVLLKQQAFLSGIAP